MLLPWHISYRAYQGEQTADWLSTWGNPMMYSSISRGAEQLVEPHQTISRPRIYENKCVVLILPIRPTGDINNNVEHVTWSILQIGNIK
jgi:hypothetical protein